MKIKAANGLARTLKVEGIPWVSCYPTNHVNNALGEEGVPILNRRRADKAPGGVGVLPARHAELREIAGTRWGHETGGGRARTCSRPGGVKLGVGTWSEDGQSR
jgi:hypothetical protein